MVEQCKRRVTTRATIIMQRYYLPELRGARDGEIIDVNKIAFCWRCETTTTTTTRSGERPYARNTTLDSGVSFLCIVNYTRKGTREARRDVAKRRHAARHRTFREISGRERGRERERGAKRKEARVIFMQEEGYRIPSRPRGEEEF